MKQSKINDYENNLIYAQTIQNGLFPKKRHFEKFYKDHFIYYKPQDKIGGDFYWLTKKDNIIYFALADCTGHGVSGAMLSVLGISLLNYVIQKKFNCIGEYLTELDKKWIETFNNDVGDNQFNNDWLEITLISFNTETREFNYASGGGELAIIQNNKTDIYKGNSYPIGGWQLEKNRVFDSYSIKLEQNAKLYFYSDGIKHQFNSNNNKKLSRKRLLNILTENKDFNMDKQKELFQKSFQEWKGNTLQTDDVLIIGLEF